MEFLTSQCPWVKQDHEFSVRLTFSAGSNCTRPDYDTNSVHGDLEFYFKPMTYKNLNDNNQMQFEQQKLMADDCLTVKFQTLTKCILVMR
jgi:hypothetical protein